MKKIFISFVLISILFSSFAQGLSHKDGTVLYQDAMTAFYDKNYGKSLKLCEDAILFRKQHITSEIEILNNSLQSRQVQKAGNSITDILKVLRQRDEYDSIDIINFYLKKKGADFFDDSLKSLLSYLDSIKVYPEAQKLIGDIYKIEGEYDFAETYYYEALKNAAVLDIPDQRYEILYLLAEISELKNDEETREVRLLNVLSEDKNFLNTALLTSMVNTIRTNKKDSLEKFFNLYRANGFYMLDAYNQLAEYYYSKGDMDKALRFVSLAAITGFTKVFDTVNKRNINFEFNGVKSVFFEASLYSDIVDWGKANNVWGSFNFLAEVAKNDGDDIFAASLLKAIAEYSPDEYYRKKALLYFD